MNVKIEVDAFSSGQVASKLWLCEELEKLFKSMNNIWIYGGWYGVTAFLLRSRGNINISTIRSFDVDAECEITADIINENWVWREWQFKAFTADCNTLDPSTSDGPDLIINTSTEHFESLDWWNNIPKGKIVVLQGNNMPHKDHHIYSDCLETFTKTFPLSELLYSGQKDFDYVTWNFSRFMLIGIK